MKYNHVTSFVQHLNCMIYFQITILKIFLSHLETDLKYYVGEGCIKKKKAKVASGSILYSCFKIL